jgi:TonB family protein
MVAAEEGHTDVVLALLSRGADPNVRDDRARTPLIHAAFHFDEEERYTTVQALLAYGADATLRDENGDTVLDRVVEDRDEDERLASLLRTVIYDGDPPRGPSLPEDPSVDALMDAIRSSEHLKAKQLAEAEIGWTARIDSTVEDSRIARSMHGWSPFEVALGYHHPYTARMLMDVGMDPCEDEETQALALAIRIGDRALSERLLDAGCSADSRDEEGHWTPLLAATYADAEIIPRLLERGAVPAVKQSDADVLMHAAAFNNYVRAMRHLKEAGLDIEARAPNGETPLMAAVNGRAAYAAEWLLKNGASVDPSQSTGNRSSDERGVLSNAEKGLATYIVKKAGAVRWETVREVVASDSAFSAQIRREEARRGVTNARWEGSAYIDVDTAPSPPGGRDKFVASMPYPDILADAGIRGTVDAHFVVTKDGAVHAIHIMSSSHEALTREVLTGLRSAQFTPGTVDGNPVTSRISMTFSFPSE